MLCFLFSMEVEIRQNESVEELFLNGLKIIQSKDLYRFTSDAVLLTKFASAKKNDIVADFCSGSGIVGLHFYALHPSVVKSVDLFELQQGLAEMSERTVQLNGLEHLFTVNNTPLQQIGKQFDGLFSLILCNPPYEKQGAGEEKLNESDRLARREIAITLEEIISIAAAKLKFGGRLCMCHRADRLADLIFEMRKNGIEPKRICFAGATGKLPYLVFIEGARGGKPGLKFEPNFEN